MNSENTDIMYLDFSNALHQVPHKISFAWSIQIGLDMSTATQFNKRQIKASWQSSNKTRRLEYLQIWNSSYHLLFINHFFIQENLSKICHKISMGSTWTNVTFTRRDTTWCSCALLRRPAAMISAYSSLQLQDSSISHTKEPQRPAPAPWAWLWLEISQVWVEGGKLWNKEVWTSRCHSKKIYIVF